MLSNCKCLHGKEIMTSRASIKQFTGADVYKSGLIAYLYTDLTHFSLKFSLILILYG